MNDRNLLILTVYIICVVYVFYRIIKSIDNQLEIGLDRESLNIQLDAQGLKDLMTIEFKLQEQYQPEQLRELPIAIENKSPASSISVDWDQSSLTDFDGRSRRVIRLIPAMRLDLFQSQVLSVIPPTQTLQERLTAEDVLKPNSDGALEITSPLFNLDQLKKASERRDRFSLRLILQVYNPGAAAVSRRPYALSCEFTVNKLPWTDALDWKPKQFTKPK